MPEEAVWKEVWTKFAWKTKDLWKVSWITVLLSLLKIYLLQIWIALAINTYCVIPWNTLPIGFFIKRKKSIFFCRLDTGICGAIIRPYHDATQSSKITLITQVRGSVPSSLKSTYLIGNPSKWLIWLKKHHDSQVNKTAEQNKENDDSSSV